MKSPLALYNEVAKEFNITEAKSLHPRQKIAWFAEQATQQRMIANRLLGDLAKAKLDLSEVKDDVAKAAYAKKVAEFSDELRQISKTLDFFILLEKELTDENPGTKITEADIPESN